MSKNTEQIVIIGGSDAGISAGLRIRELEPSWPITVILKDEFPNFSICGIPYAIGGEVQPWQNLAHRTLAELEKTGMHFIMNTSVTSIQPETHEITVSPNVGSQSTTLQYTKLMIGTGAVPNVPRIRGLSMNSANIHVLHTMSDYFRIEAQVTQKSIQRVAILGSGYIGIEMAEALAQRSKQVTIFQRGREILSTFDTDLAVLIHQELASHGVDIVTEANVQSITTVDTQVNIGFGIGGLQRQSYDLLIVATGVMPNSRLLAEAGARMGTKGAVCVDDQMKTSLPDVWAAGDLVETKHRLLGDVYLPLGTTAHKQGRIAGTAIAGGKASFKGVVGTQVLKVFGLVAARTGLTMSEAKRAGFDPLDSVSVVDDHKAYIPEAKEMTIKLIGDQQSGRLLGAQLIGAYGTEVAKRNDIFATELFHGALIDEINDLDLSYSPPLGAPWDAVQTAAQDWEKKRRSTFHHTSEE